MAGEGHIICGTCRNYRAGNGHLCRSTIGIGIDVDGGFADYVSIPATNGYKVPTSRGHTLIQRRLMERT